MADMTADDLRRLRSYLEDRVQLAAERTIQFEVPSADEMIAAGLHPDGVHQLVGAPWLAEMVEEVTETPEFCDPDDTDEQLLGYARDVVTEYFRKRFAL
jgi:hypothetical protein